jgi:hypothetical protein
MRSRIAAFVALKDPESDLELPSSSSLPFAAYSAQPGWFELSPDDAIFVTPIIMQDNELREAMPYA